MLLVKLDLINSTYKIIARLQKGAALKLAKMSIIASLWIKVLLITWKVTSDVKTLERRTAVPPPSVSV